MPDMENTRFYREIIPTGFFLNPALVLSIITGWHKTNEAEPRPNNNKRDTPIANRRERIYLIFVIGWGLFVYCRDG